MSVSIHSPRRSEGRLAEAIKCLECGEVTLFQSTPPAEARGDIPTIPSVVCMSKAFQSTPPAEARGDVLQRFRQVHCNRSFNPLPPPKRGETTRFPGMLLTMARFQSTPPAEARGDWKARRALEAHQAVSIHSPR